MRKIVTAGLLLSLGACSDDMVESYASLADAERAGAVERGWVPAFVPASARGIRDTHNLDTNAQTLIVEDEQVRISGSRKALERAVVATAAGTRKGVPSFAREWRARQDSNLRPHA